MVSSCSNPACLRELTLLNEGRLYAFERRSVDTAFFWLCPDCVPLFALFLDAMGSVAVRLRSGPRRPQPPRLDSNLRLVAGSGERAPWRWSGFTDGLTPTFGSRRKPLSLVSDAA